MHYNNGLLSLLDESAGVNDMGRLEIEINYEKGTVLVNNYSNNQLIKTSPHYSERMFLLHVFMLFILKQTYN